MSLSRRSLLQTGAAIGAAGVLPLPGCADVSTAVGAGDAAAKTVLDAATDLMLGAYPESASSAGIDKGKYAGLKTQLTDRSPAGQAAIKADVSAMAAKLMAIDRTALSPDTALNVDVVNSVFNTSAEGFEFSFGDMALLLSLIHI